MLVSIPRVKNVLQQFIGGPKVLDLIGPPLFWSGLAGNTELRETAMMMHEKVRPPRS
jgi:hypothetical protein